jgi:hypothetical protein
MAAVDPSNRAAPTANPKPFNLLFISNSWCVVEKLREAADADQ